MRPTQLTQFITLSVAALLTTAVLSPMPAAGVQPTAAQAPAAEMAAVPPPPPPGACGAPYIIKTSGAEAPVRECRDTSGNIRVNGNVLDTASDGQCAQVYATYNVSPATDYSPRACPKGTRVYFTFPWRTGTNAYIFLREFGV